MQDFFMGVVVEVEELGLGEAPPETTPPQGVIIAHRESDGWIRKYLYKSTRDLSGRISRSKVLHAEIAPTAEMGAAAEAPAPAQRETPAPVPVNSDQQIRFSQPVRVNVPGMGNGNGFGPTLGSIPTRPAVGPAPVNVMGSSVPTARQAPVMDNRLNLPASSGVKIVSNGPSLGQAQTQPPAAAPAPQDIPIPMTPAPAPAPAAAPAAPPAISAAPPPTPSTLPVACLKPIQLQDGTIINPDDTLTLKDFCAMIPYLKELLGSSQPKAPGRPGTIPLSSSPFLPSFGPAGSPFGQGGGGGFGGGGGGGGSPSGAGPIGVVTGPTPVGGPSQGTQGPPGATGPAGPGSFIDGIQKNNANFTNIGAMAIVPQTTFTIVVGGNGNVNISFSAELGAVFAQNFDVFAGVQIDSTQYELWRDTENQGSGGDSVSNLTASGELFINLTPGSHTVSMVYGQSPLNPFTLRANPSTPASIIAKHS